jgi:primosomal protein N' (replication factor Y) (superfamily II helicase)
MALKQENLVQVAVIAALPRPLTYRVPDYLEVRTGHRVFVPLGKRRALGIVLEPVGRMAPGVEPRDILAVIEPEPLLTPELLTLGLWIAEYYVAPPGEVFRAMLPLLKETRSAERIEITGKGRARIHELRGVGAGSTPSAELDLLGALEGRALGLAAAQRRFGPGLVQAALREGYVEAHRVEERQARRKVLAVRLAGPLPERLPKLSPVARRILDALAGKSQDAESSRAPREPRPKSEPIDHRSLLKSSRGSLAHLKRLEEAGLVAVEDRSAFGAPAESIVTEHEASDLANIAPFELTAEQSQALADLQALLDKRQFSTALLHGVTGSGKTEVYLRLIARALDQGLTALVMVPEIALTPAVRALFVARFGRHVAVLHSGLAQGERHQAWWRAARGEARVVLGTRSAVFAPLVNLGLIVVDEEHEASYKQDETPRYQGRDVAVVRARVAKALCVLGSATPSLESYWNAERGKYSLVRLDQRVLGRPLASVEIIDMRAEFRQTFSKIPVSRRLKEEIDVQLAGKAQTIILLNRRGYSWFLLCRSCGESPGCQNCSISLTYHRREHRLVCHYCGYSIPVPSHCPACKSEFIYYVGEGTEKIEDKFREVFPTARVERLDRDVARRAGAYERVLGAFRRHEIDILIGTQLVSTGHDFPGVTLVGVVSADHALRLPDFRAAERTFQLLTQVAGRAGRGSAPGRVLVQTFYPEHYAIRLAADQNYAGFFSKEMRFRRMMRYPPVAALAHVVAQDKKLERAVEVAKQIDRYLKRTLPDSSFDSQSGFSREDPGADTQSSFPAPPGLASPSPADPAPVNGRSFALSPTSHGSGSGFRFRVLGPSPAPLARLHGRHRIQFLIKAASRSELSRLLLGLADYCQAERVPPRSVVIDMDPVSVM